MDIKEQLRKKYNVSVAEEEYKIDTDTWKEFVKVEFSTAGYNKGKKNYIEFTDPTCPNYNVLVYNYTHDKNKDEHNPFIGFEWNEDIPNPKLRQHFNDNLEEVAFYAFKTYGLHTRKTHTRSTWKKVETDWMDNGDKPPQPNKMRSGRRK